MNSETQSAPHARGGLRLMVTGFTQSATLRVLRLVINVGVTGLLARHLGSSGFGALAAGLALVSLFYTLAELGMGRVLVRELLRDGAEPAVVLGSSFFTRFVVGIILFLCLTVYAVIFEPVHTIVLLVYGLVLLIHATTDLLAWFEAGRHMSEAAWCQFGGFAVSVAAMVTGMIFGAPLWFFALTFVIECLVASSGLFVRYHQMGGSFRSWRWEKARATGLLRESWYEIITQFALLLLLRVDSIMVQAMRGEAEAGYYGAAVRVSEVAYFLPMMLAGFMLPPMMQRKQRAASDYRERMADYFGITIAFTLPIAAVVVLASDGIIRLLFGAAFLPAAPILCIHAWALIPFALGVARTQYLTLEGRLHANVPAVFAALLINVGLNLVWIPAYGGIGAAWATLIAYSVAWVVSSPFMAGTREISSLMVLGIVRLPRLLRDTRSRLRHRQPLAPPPVSL